MNCLGRRNRQAVLFRFVSALSTFSVYWPGALRAKRFEFLLGNLNYAVSGTLTDLPVIRM